MLHMSDSKLNKLRSEILDSKHADEHTFVDALLANPVLSLKSRQTIDQRSSELIAHCRADTSSQTLLDSFLLEYGLSNQEGVALMCLAEALLRVPDGLTADRLIAEKLGDGNWLDHVGQSNSWLVNSATWGLALTGRLVLLDKQISDRPRHWFKELTKKLTAPVIRLAVLQAMKFMGGQYVLGRTIDEGIKRGYKLNKNPDVRFSFDMLGEGARTNEDAERYFQSYSDAFDHVGALNTSNSVISAHGVSVKLSALHPQYHFANYESVMTELLPKIKALCIKAKQYNIGLSIDAEEAARLEMSLDIFQDLCESPELANWRGLGFVLQAYQKRAPAVAKWLVAIAEENQRTIMVRLVKGAYWDAEIKLAQEQGFDDYPVFTRKVNTDVCYLHCAKTLLQGSPHVFPQFATHNAHTIIAIDQLADDLGKTEFEFQRLHGMGDLQYKHLPNSLDGKQIPLRVYAPVGKHRDLLPYLVRRLLENGANSSFVNRFLDSTVAPDQLARDYYSEASAFMTYRHSKIPKPADLFSQPADKRKNAKGYDLDDADCVSALTDAIHHVASLELVGHSIVAGEAIFTQAETSTNPSVSKQAAGVYHAINEHSLETAIDFAHKSNQAWQELGATSRAKILSDFADLLEEHTPELVGLINREAGRTLGDCVSEVREAVDFCRYYGQQAVLNQHRPAQGVFLCISPWNFPLAIFTGQISAALAAGNCVLAKPADPTPIIATRVTQLFHQAGVPVEVLQLLIGDGPMIGAKLLPDARLSGVAFTGSTAVAQIISRQLSEQPGVSIPFIAETGGQNCMVVDSTALPEQVVDDVIASAFHSAGQRCSALRVLYLQDVIADRVLHMLEGALALVRVGSPQKVSTDVGPIIDETARQRLLDHVRHIEPDAKRILQAPLGDDTEHSTFFAPRVLEIDSIKQLTQEVFGPVLHVIRYKMSDLDGVVNDINETGYGLTFGVHSRISSFANYLFDRTLVGNAYFNRNTIGAVVGVNPFGGRGLSGTGPKAGGPNYLLRFQKTTVEGLELKPDDAVSQLESLDPVVMPGPTGEHNEVSYNPIGNLLFVLNEQTPLRELIQIANIALALGNSITFTVRNIANRAQYDALLNNVADRFKSRILLNEENILARVSNPKHAAVVIHSSHPDIADFRRRTANRKGAIVPLLEYDQTVLVAENLNWYASFLVAERTKTDNLVAKGGNTQLFNLNEEPNH